MRFIKKNNQRGQSLVELLVAIALASLLLPALLAGISASRGGRSQHDQRLQAAAYLKQSQEAVRSIAEGGWGNIATNGTFYPVISSGKWILTPGTQSVAGLSLSVTINDTYRDSSGAIATSGGTIDPSTKKVVISVSWSTPLLSSVSATSYFTRYKNIAYLETTVGDFTGVSGNMSNLQGTAIVNNNGGEVVLGQGNANWCRPQDYILSTYTLPRQGNTIAAAAGVTSGSSNSVYVGMGNGTAGMTYQTLSVSSPPSPTPPVVGPVGAGYLSSYKTNAVANDGTYSYLATDGSSNQVVILDSSYIVKGTITLPSAANANGIYVSAGLAYVTSSNKMYVYNITNPASPQLKGTGTIWDSGATARQVVFQSGKAYVSMSGSITGLELFTVSGGGTIVIPWSVASVNWFQTPVGLAVNSTGTRAYIAFTASGSIKGGFFIVDTATRLFGFFNPNKATYNTNWDGNGTTNPLGMTIATANKAIIVGSAGSQQYQVVDTAGDNPTHCGGLSISSGVSAVTSIIQQDGRVFAYAISGEANNQFKVIEGGTGGRYTNSGTFESRIFDATADAMFNAFSVTSVIPSQTTLTYQVAIEHAISNSCSGVTYTFVGPDGTINTSFATSSATLPVSNDNIGYENPGRCLKYKANFSSTDLTQSPTLYDINFNYSP